MRKLSIITILSAAGILACSSAHAGVYSDALGVCLVKSTTASDRTNLVRWVFSSIALHPDIRAMSSITVAQRADIDKTAGGLYERLLTVDCRAETIAAVKNEGSAGLEAGFNTLGQVAMRGLFSASEVTAGMAGLTANVDSAKLTTMFKEAGINK